MAHELSLKGAHSKRAVNKNLSMKKLSGIGLVVHEAPALAPIEEATARRTEYYSILRAEIDPSIDS